MEIVKLIGADVLPERQKLILEIARLIRIGFAQQNAYHALDTYSSFAKQFKMMEAILRLHDRCEALIDADVVFGEIVKSKVFDEIIAIKYNVSNERAYQIDELIKKIDMIV